MKKQKVFIQDSLFSKTSPDSYPPTVEEILVLFSQGWQSLGRWTSGGESWTANGSEWPSDAAVCSLSQILEANVHPKYLLSPKACSGILRRAEKRGKELPGALRGALECRAAAETTPKTTTP